MFFVLTTIQVRRYKPSLLIESQAQYIVKKNSGFVLILMEKLSATYSPRLKTNHFIIETESQFILFYIFPLRCQQLFDFF